MTKKTELLDYVLLMNGSKLHLLPITQLDLQVKTAEAEKEFEPQKLEQPSYWTVEPDADGKGGERVFWTKKDVEKDGTDEEKAAWKAYELNQAQQNTFIEELVFKFILAEGTSKLTTGQGNELDLVIDPVTFEWTPPEAWRKRLNGNAPDDPYEMKFLYLAPMVKDTETRRKIVSRCTLLAMKGVVMEEDLAKYDAIFQRAMAEAGRGFDALIEELESGSISGEQATLELLVPADGATDGAGLETDTEPVGRARKKR